MRGSSSTRSWPRPCGGPWRRARGRLRRLRTTWRNTWTRPLGRWRRPGGKSPASPTSSAKELGNTARGSLFSCSSVPWKTASSWKVSILTGPFGPVQQGMVSRVGRPLEMFQSSPVLSDRCNVWVESGYCPQAVGFQSSPVLSDRCNRGSVGVEVRGRRSFNPHRSFRTGATRWRLPTAPGKRGFNPHRSFRTGATPPSMISLLDVRTNPFCADQA